MYSKTVWIVCSATDDLKKRFDYVHNVMGISHEQLSQQPGVITFRKFHVQQRHEFLKSLGKAQYNPKLQGYISLDDLVFGDDVVFCTKVAKTSINLFNDYLKTL